MKLSLPSLASLLKGLQQVAGRFPMELLFAIAGTSAAIISTYGDNPFEDTFWIRIIMCSNLGLVFSLSASTYAEASGGNAVIRWVSGAGVILLAVGYFFTLPEYLKNGDVYRFFLLSAAGHLLVAVAPFSVRGFLSGFWHYNKALFLRFLTAVLYSGVLYLGLVVALLALDKLFGLHIDERLYLRIWVLVAGLFNTTMFLAGVPLQPRQLEQETGYPKGLKIFTQFVLIPLVSIYVLILLAYEVKILVQWDLPRGWVSNLIIAFAVFGVLALLLVFPVRKNPENKWIGWYTRAFYWVLLPLVALLFLAIGTRIFDYGFTVPRFIVLATGCWLMFISLFFLFSKKEHIKLLPASLMAVTLLTTFLAFPVSRFDQKKRLFAILERYDMLEKGRMRPAPADQPDFQDRKEITSIIQYLFDTHGAAVFKEHADISFYEKDPEAFRYSFERTLMKQMHIKPTYAASSGGARRVYLRLSSKGAIRTSGYDYHIGYMEHYRKDESVLAGEHVFRDKRDESGLKVTLIADDKDSIQVDLYPLISRLVKAHLETGGSSGDFEPQAASVEAGNEALSIKVYLHNLTAGIDHTGKADSADVSFSAGYLIRVHADRPDSTDSRP